MWSVFTFSLFFPSTAIAMPMPAEMSTIARTLPLRNGLTRLFGIALRMCPYTVSGAREICAIASALSATALTIPWSIVPGSMRRKSPSPTSAATNEVNTVQANVLAKTRPMALPSPSDAIAVRIASATVGTATNWNARV